jgi:hypothetical protein
VVYVVRLIHDSTGWFATLRDDPLTFPATIHWSWEFTDRDHAASVLGVADSIARCFNAGLYQWRGLPEPPAGGLGRTDRRNGV